MKIRSHKDLDVYRLAFECGYIMKEENLKLNETYDNIIGKLVKMSLNPKQWTW